MAEANIEKHPFEPFLPENAKVLFLGSFPPQPKRWSMDFYYPNFINDMWRITGNIFFGDKSYFVVEGQKRFDKERIIRFCTEKGIALYDAASEIRRLKDNASDHFLEVVTAADFDYLLSKLPECVAIVTTGQKATSTVAEIFGCGEPEVGGETMLQHGERAIRFFRMPSTSRAYPLPIDKKIGIYRSLYEKLGIIKPLP